MQEVAALEQVYGDVQESEGDTALSILHTTAFAAGFIVLVRLGLQQKIDDWLFGSIMSLSDSDLWIAFAISSVSVLILLLFRRPILIYLFDPDIATTLGIPSRLISYGIFTLIILVLVSSLQAVQCPDRPSGQER